MLINTFTYAKSLLPMIFVALPILFFVVVSSAMIAESSATDKKLGRFEHGPIWAFGGPFGISKPKIFGPDHSDT